MLKKTDNCFSEKVYATGIFCCHIVSTTDLSAKFCIHDVLVVGTIWKLGIRSLHFKIVREGLHTMGILRRSNMAYKFYYLLHCFNCQCQLDLDVEMFDARDFS